MGWMLLMIFTQIIHSQIDTISERRKKEILNILQKVSVFGLHDYQC